jgi:hypothetical protein
LRHQYTVTSVYFWHIFTCRKRVAWLIMTRIRIGTELIRLQLSTTKDYNHWYTRWGRSVGIVRSRIKGHGVCCLVHPVDLFRYIIRCSFLLLLLDLLVPSGPFWSAPRFDLFPGPCLLLGMSVEWSWSEVIFVADGQSASMSWCRAALWDPWPVFTCSLVWHVLASWCRAPSLTRGRVCILQCRSLTDQSREDPVTAYYTRISDRVPFSSPLTIRRVAVEAF